MAGETPSELSWGERYGATGSEFAAACISCTALSRACGSAWRGKERITNQPACAVYSVHQAMHRKHVADSGLSLTDQWISAIHAHVGMQTLVHYNAASICVLSNAGLFGLDRRIKRCRANSIKLVPSLGINAASKLAAVICVRV